MIMITAYKFYWFNHSDKMQTTTFYTEEEGFDWIQRYGVEYFDHGKILSDPLDIWLPEAEACKCCYGELIEESLMEGICRDCGEPKPILKARIKK